MSKAIEAAASALWHKHYLYGPGSIGQATAKPFPAVTGASRQEYLADAQAAITAYLAAMKAEGPSEAVIEAIMPLTGFAGEAMARQAALDIWSAMIAAATHDDGGE